MANKYVSLNKLSLFLGNLKNTFASIVHTHAISDITDLQTTLDSKQDEMWALNNFEQQVNKIQDITVNSANETAYPSAKAVYNFGQTFEEMINNKVNIFHATLDTASLKYVKDSADFTYEQVKNTENCIIEVQFANEKAYLIKQEFKNINPPDEIAGRYVGFSNIIRTNGQMAELFIFVYDPENLPTDEASLEVLADWGDSQYCVSSYQPIVMGNFLDKDISANRANDINAPSTKAAGDYTDNQCGIVLNYMQTTFADNIMTLCNNRFAPHIIYSDPTGFEASNEDVGKWQLTGLDLSQYAKLKFYIRSAGDGDTNWSPSHIVELHLDDRARGSNGHFTAGHTAVCPNSTGRFHNVIVSVSSDKTSLAFNRSNRYNASTSATSIEGRCCYLIEGYLI